MLYLLDFKGDLVVTPTQICKYEIIYFVILIKNELIIFIKGEKMKTIYSLGLILSFLLLFTKNDFAQTSHTVLVGPDGKFVFEPADLIISTGDTIRWEWQSNNHTTTSNATSGDEVWDTGILNNGATFSKVFTIIGTYPYNCTPHKSLGMTGTITVQNFAAVDSYLEHQPDQSELKQNFLNPFNPSTTISCELPTAKHVELKIYNTSGQEIFTFLNSLQFTGSHQVVWFGRDNTGNSVPRGVYFYQLKAGSVMQTRKMVLIRYDILNGEEYWS